MKRRENGEGCVKKLPSGSYRWQVTLGFDERGKQLLKSGTEKTKKDADRARMLALADHQRGLLPIPEPDPAGRLAAALAGAQAAESRAEDPGQLRLRH